MHAASATNDYWSFTIIGVESATATHSLSEKQRSDGQIAT
jgi:hypothetical protein